MEKLSYQDYQGLNAIEMPAVVYGVVSSQLSVVSSENTETRKLKILKTEN